MLYNNAIDGPTFIYYIFIIIIYYIFILGKESGTWFIDLKNGKGVIGKGEPSQPADAILTMDSENFFAMFSGRSRNFLSNLFLHLLYYYIVRIYKLYTCILLMLTNILLLFVDR